MTTKTDSGDKAYHPSVNPQNRHVQDMPERFSEGDVLAKYDDWTDTETSHWVVRSVDEATVDDTDCGFRYKLEAMDGDAAMFKTHGELQVLASRNSLRWSA